VIITGAGGSGVLLSDACVDNGLALMSIPDDLDRAFREYIPPFGRPATRSTSPAANRRPPTATPSRSASPTNGCTR